ncbi:hypothetical protein J6590_055512 [Homalodisca vitripennis]|nr:hypothetical protein J6590_055512 [Homalodisca vitripennis]
MTGSARISTPTHTLHHTECNCHAGLTEDISILGTPPGVCGCLTLTRKLGFLLVQFGNPSLAKVMEAPGRSLIIKQPRENSHYQTLSNSVKVECVLSFPLAPKQLYLRPKMTPASQRGTATHQKIIVSVGDCIARHRL